MSIYEVVLHDGPDRADLLRASKRRHKRASVPFHSGDGVLEAQVDAVEDLNCRTGDVAIRGHILTGAFKGRSFVGTYDPETRKGSLNLARSP